jgi:hypothetical protein
VAVSKAVLVFLLARLTAVATELGALPFLFCPYSPECVEVEFSEVRCATGRASLLLDSGPRLRHSHRSKLPAPPPPYLFGVGT